MNKRQEMSPTTPDKQLKKWQLPPLPSQFRDTTAKHEQTQPSLRQLSKLTKSRLASTRDYHAKVRTELSIIDWLYKAIRLNIKRGRLFEVDRVLSERQADCLGYAKLFHLLGKRLGLNTGIVEVVVDNAGRFVPHVANIIRLSDKRWRFIDLWYGSRNVHHRRLGLMVKQSGRWQTLDAYRRELLNFSDIKGLPTQCIDAITYYMLGNRHLEQGILFPDRTELDEAIRCYTAAIMRYPQNARFYFNRALAYENRGKRKSAGADYAIALHNEAGLIRVLATQHDEVVQLIALDQIELSTRDQEIYLLRRGFVTGSEVPQKKVATKYRLSADEVNRITSSVEAQLLSTA